MLAKVGGGSIANQASRVFITKRHTTLAEQVTLISHALWCRTELLPAAGLRALCRPCPTVSMTVRDKGEFQRKPRRDILSV